MAFPTPIETRYNGYRFRSRLEARWAVFFDALGVQYEYEREGYRLGDGLHFLPDFWIPDLASFIEIKAAWPDNGSDDWGKASRLAQQSGKCVYVFFGPIAPPQGDWKSSENASALVFFPKQSQGDEGWWFAYWWCICPACKLPLIAFAGDGSECPRCELVGADPRYTYDDPALLHAYTRARSARFEFGEQG